MAPKKIICICPNPSVDTFITADDLQPGSLNRVWNAQHYPGGKGVHVALATAELGYKSAVLAFWAGPTGKWLQEKCLENNVACHGPEIAGWNRINTTLRSEGNWNETELVAQGPHISKNDYAALQQELERLLPQAAAVVMSGSWPAGAPDDAYGPLIDLAKSQGVPTWVDCSGTLLLNALSHHPFGLHINQHESKTVVPSAYQDHPAGFFLQFVEESALTAGADGLTFSTNLEMIHATCRLENIHSAVGSGDCLTAGLVIAHLRKYDAADTARFAAACGSANCLREELGLLFSKDVETLLSKVKVTRK